MQIVCACLKPLLVCAYHRLDGGMHNHEAVMEILSVFGRVQNSARRRLQLQAPQTNADCKIAETRVVKDRESYLKLISKASDNILEE